VPKTLLAWDAAGNAHPVHALWNRRHTTNSNGVAYRSRRQPPRSSRTPAGADPHVDRFLLANAKLIREAVATWGFSCVGGDNAPYIWINTGRDSWEFFDLLLNNAQVVCTPGGRLRQVRRRPRAYQRVHSRANVETALAMIAAALKK